MIKHIVIVEDETDIRDMLSELLISEGYRVTSASDGIEALTLIAKSEPDLVVLDLGLPKMSGESVCLDIIILTARDTSMDVIHGFQLGADDYIAKPFNMDELLARVKARLRSVNHEDEKLVVADLELDPKNFEVRRGETRIPLTPQEYKLLQYLMINKGQVLTRDMILNRIWPNSPDVETRVVDVYVGYLRKKIDQDFSKKLIHSVRGFGYSVREEDHQSGL